MSGTSLGRKRNPFTLEPDNTLTTEDCGIQPEFNDNGPSDLLEDDEFYESVEVTMDSGPNPSQRISVTLFDDVAKKNADKDGDWDVDKYFTEYQFSDEDFDPSIPRVEVQKSVTFNKIVSSRNEALLGKLKIRNKSNLIISYTVQTSAIAKFKFTKSPGWIAPYSKTEVKVRTRRTTGGRNYYGLIDIVDEFFVVVAAPIFHKEHLTAKNLDTFWMGYGSYSFPYYHAEQHIANLEIPWPGTSFAESADYLGYSILDAISLKKRNLVKKVFKKSNPVENTEFDALWDLKSKFQKECFITECRIRELKRTVSRCALKSENERKSKRNCLNIIMITIVTGFAISLPMGNTIWAYISTWLPNNAWFSGNDAK